MIGPTATGEGAGPVVNEPVNEPVNQPVQVRAATVLANEPAGAYRRLALAAPVIAGRALPGQFLALAVGEEPTANLLRRAFSIHAVDPAAGRVEIVVAAHGVGSTWVTRRRPGDTVDVIGPLGRPFPAAAAAGPCIVVGGGYGSAPLAWLAGELHAAGHEVHAVLGAADAARLFGVEGCGEVAASVSVTTDDGSAGRCGWVSDVLPDVLARSGARTVYACGPMAMLRAVTALAAEHGAVAWCTVEEAMACGIGVCMTCVLPVRGADGVTRMVRSCVEGPSFDGADVRWDSVCSGPGGRGSAVPEDCLGAPTPAAVH